MLFRSRKISDLSTTRISLDTAGAQLTVASTQPALSSDGRFVAYVTAISGASQVLLYDVQAAATSTVSQKEGATGTGQTTFSNGNNTEPSISADGRYVVFTSAATDLLAAGKDTNGFADIYLRDTVAKLTTRVSVTAKGEEANKASSKPRISSDWNYVVYVSEATNLVSGDVNGVADIFLYNVGNKTTTRVSVSSDGTEANGVSSNPFVAKEGAYVTFASTATNLGSADTNGNADVFVYTKASGAVERISFEPGTGTKEQREAKAATAGGIADDGRYATLVLLSDKGTKGPTQALSVYQFSNGRTLKINPSSGTELTFTIAFVAANMSLSGQFIIIQAQNWPLTLRGETISAGPQIIRVSNPLYTKK